jgi:hypothetical protein
MPRRSESRTATDICTSMFIAALFTIIKRRKQSNYPSADEENMVYIYME